MADILEEFFFKLGIIVKGETVIYIIAGTVAVLLILFVLIILRRRKFRKIVKINLTDSKEGGDEQAENTYEPVIKRIKQVRRKYKSILFVSTDVESLPVTIPVNTAINLAKNKKRCLLIDLDLKRDAVAKAFGLDAEQSGLRAKAVQTEFENLWVRPGHTFSQSKQMNVMRIVEKALDKKSPHKFDFVLINAPALVNSPDRKQIILAARAAFICSKNASDEKRLTGLVKPLACTIIGHIHIPE